MYLIRLLSQDEEKEAVAAAQIVALVKRWKNEKDERYLKE
jgi:hypothetical protein